jgi:hypothetical protein
MRTMVCEIFVAAPHSLQNDVPTNKALDHGMALVYLTKSTSSFCPFITFCLFKYVTYDIGQGQFFKMKIYVHSRRFFAMRIERWP